MCTNRYLEVEVDTQIRIEPQTLTQNSKTSYKCPTIGLKLRRINIKRLQNIFLKMSKSKYHPQVHEDHRIHVEELVLNPARAL